MPLHTVLSKTQIEIDSGWLPFEFIGPGAPIVTFSVIANGSEPIRLTLDTGNASGLHISEASARRLGLDFSKPLEIPVGRQSFGEDFVPSAFEANLRTLTIGDWKLADVEATISNYIDYLAESLNAPWEANLGRELMKDLSVVIDYPGSRLRFTSAGRRETTTSFRIGDAPWIIVRARIHDSSLRSFILDTGAGGTMISATFATEIGLELGEEVDVLGATGMGKARLSQPTSVKIGHRKVDGLRLNASEFIDQLSIWAGIELAGVIGYDYLQESIVTIDYKQRRIGFK